MLSLGGFRYRSVVFSAETEINSYSSISSNYTTFSFDNSSDSTPTPATVTITATQQNQTSNLVTGDLAVTNGSKSTGSYSGSDGTGTYTWVVTPSGTYPVTCVVSNDSLSDTVIINKVVGAASLSISSSSPTFGYDNAADTSATPSTATITARQQNQTSNLVDGDLERRAPVAIIGSEIEKLFFPLTNPIGQTGSRTHYQPYRRTG